MHAHIWHGHYEKNKYTLLKTIETYNIEKMFVSPLGNQHPDEEMVADLNNEMEKFKKENPDKIEGYVYISPEHKNAIDVLKKGIEEQGMTGVKFWVSEKCDSSVVNPIAEKIIEYNVPLLIHAFKKTFGQLEDESTSVNVRNLALRYPELKIIMAHVDGNCYHGVQLVRELNNVWIDISGSMNRAGEVEYTLENIPEDRILFGTDSPGCFAPAYGKLLEADIAENVKQKIFYDNTIKLFNRNFKIQE